MDMKLRSAGVERFRLDQSCWRLPLTPLAEFTLFSKEMDSHTLTLPCPPLPTYQGEDPGAKLHQAEQKDKDSSL